MKTALLLLLRFYQLAISPYLGQNCRFYPSCSDYARQAIDRHGAAAGMLLATRRLCKCHPWHAGGVDPVPDRQDGGPASRRLQPDLRSKSCAANPDS